MGLSRRQGSDYSLRLRSSDDRRLKIGRLVLSVLILSALLYIGLRAYIKGIGSGEVLLVDGITVRGNRFVPTRELIEASGIRVGDEMRRVNPEGVAAILLSRFRYLRRVEVQKSLSGEVIISVQERSPAALFLSGGVYNLVDEEGKILEEDVSPLAFEGLKLIEGRADLIGVSLSTLRYVRMLSPSMYDRLRSVEASSPMKLKLRLEDGTEVLLSMRNLEEELENAYLVYSIRKSRGLEGGYIDARYEKIVYCGGI